MGAGHDGAAAQLTLRLRGLGFEVDRHDFLDLIPAGLGRLVSESYRLVLTIAPSTYQRIYSATENAERPGPLTRLIQRSTHRRLLRGLPPDTRAVVATYPIAGQVLGTLRRKGRLAVPAATYLTDFSVHPLWVAPGVDLHLAAHPVPAGQAREHGAERVVVAGPVVDPRFTPATETQRGAARARFGLPPDTPLALLVAGSWGVGEVAKVAAEIRDTGTAVPVVVCGKNQPLAERLRADGIEHAFGWVADMPSLMHACDVLVQNAGGLTSLEAFACGLPAISYRCIPGHGQTNAAALDQAGLAPWIQDPADLAPALTAMADGTTGHRYREAGLALHHNASGPANAIAAVAEHFATTVPSPVIPAQRRRPGREAAPAPRRPIRRLGLVAAAFAATGWLATGGTQLAVTYGGFDTIDADHTGRTYLVVHPPHGERIDDATLRTLAAEKAAMSIDAAEAAADPGEVRRLASAGLTLVNAGYGPPYATGLVTRRDSLEAGATALHADTGAATRFFLSGPDLDALDLGLAAYHHEHLVVPDTRIACGSSTPPEVKPGQVVLVECGSARPADLSATLHRLLTPRQLPRLGALTTLS
ncbi:glycosyltransferase [Kitasatospora sp. NPDC004669]|uniref:MGDG synthase family glycosyltransferase n=1 Tax=Kitasatospora sp. NPDC004669 TaxID=3154555 RepID=UPI0033AAA65D